MGILSDEEFSKLDTDAVMEAINNYGTEPSYEEPVVQQQQQQEQYVPETQVQPQQEYNPEQTNQEYTGTEQDSTTSPEYSEPDYVEVYKKITSPFKASGKEFQVRNVDEAITLMQKGVDYTRKQQALKPRLMELKTLESQNMLGDNLNFAIDLYNGKPEAIAKLIREKGIDLNKLSNNSVDEYGNPVEQTADSYVPTNYTISPERYELTEVVDELKSTDLYGKVADAYEAFDPASRDKFIKNPKLMLELGNHIKSGLYDKIQAELEHAKLVSSPLIANLSDFDAYTKVGEMIVSAQQRAQYQQPTQSYVAPTQPMPNNNNAYRAVQQRKQAVSPIRANSGAGRSVSSYDPLTCSDEEFSKIKLEDLLRG